MKFDFKKWIPKKIDFKEFFSKILVFFKNLPEKIKSINRKKLKRYLPPCLMLFFAAIFLVCAGVLAKRAWEDHHQAEQYDHLAGLVQQEQAQVQRPPVSNNGTSYVEPLSAFVEIAHPVTGEPVKVLREYAAVYQLNPDMAGWINIPNTILNYPVVQTPGESDYYLHRDFYDKNSRHGTIFAHNNADLQTPSDIVTLYGHNMNDGSMFASLHSYTSKEYYDKNPYIYFDTLYEHRTYQIISAFEIDITKSDFDYHNYVDTNAFSFQNYIDNCKKLSLYDTGASAKYGDKLLALSTCDNDYADDDVRFVIVAKLVS
ncbi:MAG: class B sortase [Oscillospiraceae bacterium]|nr:class B sortase [Oscillospiraceae bacterium]